MDAQWVVSSYADLDTQLKRWEASERECAPLLRTLADFHSRLHLLSADNIAGADADARRFGVLATHGAGLVRALRDKHVAGVHNLLAALRDALAGFESVRDGMGANYAAAWRRLMQQSPSVDAATQPLAASAIGALGMEARARVGVPSVVQCIEDLAAIHDACSREVALKASIADQLADAASAADVDELTALWALRPHFDSERAAFVTQVVLALTPA